MKTVDIKKQKLLKMAKNGEDRPSSKEDGLGMALVRYTSKKSGSYDPEFDKEIRESNRSWFVKDMLTIMSKARERRMLRACFLLSIGYLDIIANDYNISEKDEKD